MCLGEIMYTTDLLKKMRKKQNLTIYDMGKQLNISAVYYYQIETKQRSLSYLMAVKISQIFNMKPDELFYEKAINKDEVF